MGAKKCVDSSMTSLGVVCSDGIVLATMKPRLNRMLVAGTNRFGYPITKKSGMISCGMAPEGRYVLKRARSEASNYLKTYGEAIPGYLLAERTGAFMHLFTQYGSVRPLGCALLIANCDEADGPTLYSCEACGTVQKWFGKAFGKGRQLANTELEKLNLKC